jgi:hypothetical protein
MIGIENKNNVIPQLLGISYHLTPEVASNQYYGKAIS